MLHLITLKEETGEENSLIRRKQFIFIVKNTWFIMFCDNAKDMRGLAENILDKMS